MKTRYNKTGILATALIATVLITSCKKDNFIDSNAEALAVASAVASVQAVAVTTTTTGDSIYVINTCSRDQKKDNIAFSDLPATAAAYLTTNYAGYTAVKALAIKNASGTVAGYVAVILFNSKPVGVKFDATGAFVKVLEQREGHDIGGGGFHHGGHFDDRDGQRRDTIALSALPSSVKAYMAANHPQDTLVLAFQNRDNSIVIVSINNGVFSNVFSTSGSFIKRDELPGKHGRANSIELSALPANSQAYLAATYPNYVFNHAFKIMADGVVKGYVVLIDANETKYGIEFDASGGFVKAVTIR